VEVKHIKVAFPQPPANTVGGRKAKRKPGDGPIIRNCDGPPGGDKIVVLRLGFGITWSNDRNVVAVRDQRLGEISRVLLSAAWDIPGIRAHHANSHDRSLVGCVKRDC
jgi:hypothetical protein